VFYGRVGGERRRARSDGSMAAVTRVKAAGLAGKQGRQVGRKKGF